MRKIILIIMIICLMVSGSVVKASEMCTVESAQQLAKIIYHENGFANFLKGNNREDEFFFVELVTGGVALNLANRKDGVTWYDKFYNLTDNSYAGYSNYKDRPFEENVPASRRGELLYVAELILTGKFNLPKNLIGQSECSCLLGANNCPKDIDKGTCKSADGWGKEWTHIEDNNPNALDPYFGYSKYESLATTDIWGNKLSDTSPEYYKKLAKKLRLSDYSKYTSKTVCGGLSDSSGNKDDDDNNGDNNKENVIIDACNNPEVLKVIYFIKILLNIVKIVIPIALIIMGIIDFSKSMIITDENVQKKAFSLFGKRILSAIIIFAMPWIIEVLVGVLGTIFKDANYAECLDNANKNKIEQLEKEISNGNSNGNSNGDKPFSPLFSNIVFVGDSRTNGMCSSISLDSDEYCVSKSGAGYSWLTSNELRNELNKYLNSSNDDIFGDYFVFNMGTNSGFSDNEAKDYASFYNRFANSYSNNKVVVVSVTQVDYQKAKDAGMYKNITLDDNSVKNFNNVLKSNLNSNVIYCDVYSKMENYDYVASDGVHYNADTYNFIYKEIKNCISIFDK